jgi:hypothetical protein
MYVHDLRYRYATEESGAQGLSQEIVLLQPIVDTPSADAEKACCFGAVVTCCSQRVQNHFAFHFIQRRTDFKLHNAVSRLRPSELYREMIREKLRTFADKNGSLNHILQLTHIAGPRI